VEEALRDVVAHGAPAQVAQARRLLELLEADPHDPGAAADRDALVNAYLHDPHLTR